MTAPSGLAWPPDHPAELARIPSAALPLRLHRLSHWTSPWWFSSAGAGDQGGRFDLPTPHGTCYLAENLEGALLEKVLRRPRQLVAAEQLTGLFHVKVAVVTPPPTADLTAAAVTGLGVNAEISTGLDYAKPRAWAAALHRAGWYAVRYALRGDSSLRQRGVALFGRAGLHRRAPAGFRTSLTTLDPVEAAALLERRGVGVHPIPLARGIPLVPPSG